VATCYWQKQGMQILYPKSSLESPVIREVLAMGTALDPRPFQLGIAAILICPSANQGKEPHEFLSKILKLLYIVRQTHHRIIENFLESMRGIYPSIYSTRTSEAISSLQALTISVFPFYSYMACSLPTSFTLRTPGAGTLILVSCRIKNLFRHQPTVERCDVIFRYLTLSLTEITT
jgi:hypothetical protein